MHNIKKIDHIIPNFPSQLDSYMRCLYEKKAAAYTQYNERKDVHRNLQITDHSFL